MQPRPRASLSLILLAASIPLPALHGQQSDPSRAFDTLAAAAHTGFAAIRGTLTYEADGFRHYDTPVVPGPGPACQLREASLGRTPPGLRPAHVRCAMLETADGRAAGDAFVRFTLALERWKPAGWTVIPPVPWSAGTRFELRDGDGTSVSVSLWHDRGAGIFRVDLWVYPPAPRTSVHAVGPPHCAAGAGTVT